MIRRDYILREVQELAQILARAIFLRARGDYESALTEIGRALRSVGATPTDSSTPNTEGWIKLCREHEEVTGPLMIAVASLLREQGVNLAETRQLPAAAQARSAALALHLEAILTGAVPVTAESLAQIEGDITSVDPGDLEPAALARLMAYYEERGQLAAAEDVLFDWLDRGDAGAATAGRAFYERLRARTEEDLVRGGLSPSEVEQGLHDLTRKLQE